MDHKQGYAALRLKIRKLLIKRNRLNQQIRTVYGQVRKIDQEIAELRLAQRKQVRRTL